MRHILRSTWGILLQNKNVIIGEHKKGAPIEGKMTLNNLKINQIKIKMDFDSMFILFLLIPCLF